MLEIPTGYAQVIHSLAYAGDPEPFAVTYGVDVALASPTPNDTATACATAFKDNLQALLPTAISLVQTEVYQRDADAPAPLSVGVDTSQNFTGTGSATNLLPQNSTFLVQKRTASAGRRNRGRMYMPQPAEAQVSNLGVVDSGVVTAWNALLTTWLSDLVATDEVINMVILHSTGVSSVPEPTVVTSLNLDTRIATQRTRLRR